MAVPSITYWAIDPSNFVHPVRYKPGCLLYELVYKRWKPTLACRHIQAYDKLTTTIYLDENERVTTIELYLLADYRYSIDKRMMTECWCDRSPAPCVAGGGGGAHTTCHSHRWLIGRRACGHHQCLLHNHVCSNQTLSTTIQSDLVHPYPFISMGDRFSCEVESSVMNLFSFYFLILRSSSRLVQVY